MNKQIRQVHFQITRNCNLRCAFCGQWGKKGFFADSRGEEMSLDEWEDIIGQLRRYRDKTGINPTVTVWGGEPLASPYFDDIIRSLKDNGFTTEIVTNGVLLDEHKDAVLSYVDTVYVSIDGVKSVHDTIRGDGVYEKVTANLRDMGHKNVTVMSVITPELLSVFDEFLSELDTLGIKRLYLQDMIGLTSDEVKEYKTWMKSAFDIDAEDISSWENNDKINFDCELAEILSGIDPDSYSYTIEHKSHTTDRDVRCRSPFNHMHITWNGNVLFCTDFYDFKAGNVKDASIEDIFFGQMSERYREEIENGRCVSCNHCSWRSKDTF